MKPHGQLLRYLSDLTETEHQDVFSKLAAAGYAAPGREDFVATLSDSDLRDLGIEPQALRKVLLKAFALSGGHRQATAAVAMLLLITAATQRHASCAAA